MKAKEADWFKRMHEAVEQPSEESKKHWLNRWEGKQDKGNERLKNPAKQQQRSP